MNVCLLEQTVAFEFAFSPFFLYVPFFLSCRSFPFSHNSVLLKISQQQPFNILFIKHAIQ